MISASILSALNTQSVFVVGQSFAADGVLTYDAQVEEVKIGAGTWVSREEITYISTEGYPPNQDVPIDVSPLADALDAIADSITSASVTMSEACTEACTSGSEMDMYLIIILGAALAIYALK